MFFVFSKTFALLAIPSNLIGVLFIIGFALFAMRLRATGKRLVTVSIIFLMLFGFLPLGSLLLLPLTERFPAWSNHDGDPDGMIVLGGGINPEVSTARDSIEVTGSAGRIFAVADLARRFPRSRVVVSGGSGDLHDPLAIEAPLTVRLLERLGVATERIILEDHSRNTAENAAFTRELLQPKAGERWLLITSAYHMPRAVGCFRNVGIPVEPYPVDWQSAGWTGSSISISTLSNGLSRTDIAVHEWLGLFVYWITGRTIELFPGPRE
jgi:uncharacterized SAM-binding protein YcdF (DUF218 family)